MLKYGNSKERYYSASCSAKNGQPLVSNGKGTFIEILMRDQLCHYYIIQPNMGYLMDAVLRVDRSVTSSPSTVGGRTPTSLVLEISICI